jgi:hypothetical protein
MVLEPPRVALVLSTGSVVAKITTSDIVIVMQTQRSIECFVASVSLGFAIFPHARHKVFKTNTPT